MSAFGCGPLENDTAQDLKCVWDDFLLPALRGCNAGEASSLVERFIFAVVFADGVNHHSQDHNYRWLAIAELLTHGGHQPSERAKAHIERAVYEESRPDEISAWPDPLARKKALKRVLSQIEGRRLKKSEIPKSGTIAEELHDLRGFLEYIDVFCGIRSPKEVSAVAFDYEFFERFKRSNAGAIERSFLQGVGPFGERSDDEYELLQLRMVSLAYWVGCKIDLEPPELLAFCRRAAKATSVGGIGFGTSI